MECVYFCEVSLFVGGGGGVGVGGGVGELVVELGGGYVGEGVVEVW